MPTHNHFENQPSKLEVHANHLASLLKRAARASRKKVFKMVLFPGEFGTLEITIMRMIIDRHLAFRGLTVEMHLFENKPVIFNDYDHDVGKNRGRAWNFLWKARYESARLGGTIDYGQKNSAKKFVNFNWNNGTIEYNIPAVPNFILFYTKGDADFVSDCSFVWLDFMGAYREEIIELGKQYVNSGAETYLTYYTNLRAWTPHPDLKGIPKEDVVQTIGEYFQTVCGAKMLYSYAYGTARGKMANYGFQAKKR